MFWGRRARFLEGLHFWYLNLRISLPGQCSISYDLGSWFQDRRGTSETCLHFRGSLAENTRFGSPDLSVFEEVSHKTLNLEVRIFGFRGSLAEFARLQEPDTSAPKGSSHRELERAWDRDLAEVVLQDPDTVVQGPDTEILFLHKWSYRILIQVVQKGSSSWDRDLTSGPTGSWYKWSKRMRILKQRSCTSGPTGSSYRDLAQVVFQDPDRSGRKGSWNRDLAQVLLKDNTSGPKEILNSERQVIKRSLKQRFCTSGATRFWYKWSKRILTQRSSNSSRTSGWKGSWYKWSKRILIRRFCTSGPTGWSYKSLKRILMQVVEQEPDTEILHKWSKRIMIQVVQKNPHTAILIQRSCSSATTGSWYKWSKRILIQRSCTSDPTGPWDKWSERILIQIWILMRKSYRSGPAQVVLQHPDRSRRKGSWNREFPQVVLQDDTSGPKMILMQRSCTSGPTGSWYKRSKRVLIQGSWNRGLAQVVLKILRQRSCASATTGPWCKWSQRTLIQRSKGCEFTFASRGCTLTRTLFGVFSRDNPKWKLPPLASPRLLVPSNYKKLKLTQLAPSLVCSRRS